jgi:hypothetical protein
MISVQDYVSIASAVGGGYDDLTLAIAELTAQLTTLQQATVSDESARQKLNDAILQCSTALASSRYPSMTQRGAVAALQKHVTTFAGSVNTFLSSHGIKVTQSFAKISAVSGYDIAPANIQP